MVWAIVSSFDIIVMVAVLGSYPPLAIVTVMLPSPMPELTLKLIHLAVEPSSEAEMVH